MYVNNLVTNVPGCGTSCLLTLDRSRHDPRDRPQKWDSFTASPHIMLERVHNRQLDSSALVVRRWIISCRIEYLERWFPIAPNSAKQRETRSLSTVFGTRGECPHDRPPKRITQTMTIELHKKIPKQLTGPLFFSLSKSSLQTPFRTPFRVELRSHYIKKQNRSPLGQNSQYRTIAFVIYIIFALTNLSINRE